MDKLNNLKEKIPPNFLPYLQMVMLLATSFYQNCVVSIRTIYIFISSYKTINLNASTLNEIINKEVNRSNNKNVFNVGVWLSVVYIIYCSYLILWYVIFGLFCVLLVPTICWLLLWGVITFVKDNISRDKMISQIEKDDTKNTILKNEIENKLNLEKDSLNKFD